MAKPKKKKKKYVDILRAKPKRLRGGQTVPMDIDKINAAMTAANS